MGFALSSCQGCQGSSVSPVGTPGTTPAPSSSKVNPGLPRLCWVLAKPCASRALWLLCGCSWQTPQGPDELQRLLSSKLGVWGCWGGTGGAGSCPLHRWCPRCQGWQGRCSVAGWEQIHVPGSCSCCGLSPHHPRAGTELGMGLSRGPGQPARAAKSLDGFGMDGGCCWPGASGISSLGDSPNIQAVMSYGCPPTSVPSQGVPVPHGEQRGPLALSQSPSLGPAPEQWLGKSRVWSQGREQSRAQSEYFQWFNGMWVGHSCLGDDGCTSWLPRDRILG